MPAPGHVDAAFLDQLREMCGGLKERMWQLLAAAPDACILDFGCGPASDTLDLARRLGPFGRIFGVDHDPEMISLAEIRRLDSELAGQVEHHGIDGGRLPFEDGCIDAVRCERVFQHLRDPAAVLSELHRVCRQGGRIVILDPDNSATQIDLADPGLEDFFWRFKRVRSEYFQNPSSALALPRRLAAAGWRLVQAEIHPMQIHQFDVARRFALFDAVEEEMLRRGMASPEELLAWRSSLEAQQRQGLFFAYTNLIITSAVKL
ncbi:MAG: hypothetical protein RL095_1348 [Verrucomicrobiota bacterium]|jgi:SAM-dependent methyltransferase